MPHQEQLAILVPSHTCIEQEEKKIEKSAIGKINLAQ